VIATPGPRSRLWLLALLVALASCGGPGQGATPSASGPSSSALCPPFPSPPAGSGAHPTMLVQRGHASSVRRMALSDDGRILVTMSYDGTLLVWDTTTGLLLRRILAPGMPFHVALSASGDTLAYATSNADDALAAGTFVVDLARGGAPREAAGFGPIALSPDGKRLVVGGHRVEVFDTETLALVHTLDIHFGSLFALALGFDRSGKRLAIAAASEVAVVDASSWAITQRSPRSAPASEMPTRLDFTGDMVVLRVAPASVELLAIGASAAPATRLQGRVRESAGGGGKAWILGESEQLASAPGGRFVQRLAAHDPSGARVFEEELPPDATGIAASGDGSIIALARDDGGSQGLRTVTLRDGATSRPLRTLDLFTSAIAAVGIDPRRNALITRTTLGTLARWDLERGSRLAATAADEDTSPGAQILVDAEGALLVSAGFESTVRVRPASGGAQLRQWAPHRDHPVVAASFLAASRELLTVSSAGEVARWDLSPEVAPPPRAVHRYAELNRPTGREIAALGKPIWRATLSPDGRSLAYDGEAGAVGILDATTGARRWEVASPSTFGEQGRKRWIAFSSDDSRLFLSASEGTRGAKDAVLRVFDARSGALLDTVHPGTTGPIAARAKILALGGVHPVLLDPVTFGTRAEIDAFDSEVTAVAIHPSRDLLALGGSGGATAIASALSGAPLALLLASRGGDFISTTPEGAFVASVDGARALAWTFDAPLEAFAFDQFAAVYEQPEAVRRRLAGEPPRVSAPLIRPPRLTISGAPPGGVASRSISLHAEASSAGRVDRLRVFVNGRATLDQAVCAPRAGVDLAIPLLAGHNRVSLWGYDAAGFAGTPKQLDILSTDTSAPRPQLWIVSVGVSRYPKLDPSQQLEFATADARSMTEQLADQAGPGKPFAELHATTLLDEEVSVEAVVKAIEGLASMGPDDLAVVFFAGHGVQLDGEGPAAGRRMVFLTSDTALTTASAREHGVGWDRIEGALGKARGRVLMLLDACHSGHVSTALIAPNEALAQKLASSGRAGVLVFAASRGAELSYEVPATGKPTSGRRGLSLAWEGSSPPLSAKPGGGGHGLFTGAVLEALRGGAPDRDRSGAVEASELIDFVTERVRAASNGKQTPWVARREMFGDFVLARGGGGAARGP
jgi:WD40 repeat protein/uncharacterized caspase-like protein